MLLAALAGCGPERGAITAGGRVAGDNLTVYSSVPQPDRGVGRDMVDASKLAIAEAGGRAGDFGINFVSVDEGELGAPNPRRVPAKAAEQAIRDAQVIAVVGALRSDAATTMLPLFNAAGVLLVSPGAGYAGFTEPVGPGEPERWSPSGRDTFARVIGDDTEQAQALVGAAGGGRIAVEAEAGRTAQALARAIADTGANLTDDVRRADAVIYAGSDVTAAQGVAESLADEAPKATLVFPDELTRAGLAERLDNRRAVFVTAAPEPGSTEDLRAFERAFEERFERAPDPYAVLAHRATARALQAIADGGARARLRRVVVERYLALPPPPEDFVAFRMRGGERQYAR